MPTWLDDEVDLARCGRSGDLHAHDPFLIRHEGAEGGDWFVFSTGSPDVPGGTIQIRRSNWPAVAHQG